jgi:hypothetical protein
MPGLITKCRKSATATGPIRKDYIELFYNQQRRHDA